MLLTVWPPRAVAAVAEEDTLEFLQGERVMFVPVPLSLPHSRPGNVLAAGILDLDPPA